MTIEIILRRPLGTRYWLACVALLCGLNLYAPGEPTISERALATALFLLSMVTIWAWSRDGELEIAFMPIMMGLSAISYALPVFFMMPGASLSPFPLADLEFPIDKSLSLTIICLSLMLVGYYAPWRKGLSRFLPKLRLASEDIQAIKIVSWVAAIIGLTAVFAEYHYDLPDAVHQPIALVGDMCFLPITALLLLQLTQGLDWASAIFLLGIVIPARVLLGLMSGFLASGVLVAVSLLLTYATVKRRIPWAIVLVGFIALSIMQPAKGAFRREVWSGGTTNLAMSDSDRFASLANSVSMGQQVAQTVGPQAVGSIVAERLGAPMIAFVQVAQLTPQAVPYWMGESYYPVFFKLIPRAIYPDKPEEGIANEFGHRYGFLMPSDYSTAINLPQIVEFYVNFGIPGVLLGGFLLGVFYRFVTDMFLHPDMGFGALAGAIYIATNWLLANEGNFSVVNGLVLGQVLMILLFVGVVRLTSTFLRSLRLRSIGYQSDRLQKNEKFSIRSDIVE